MELRSSKGQYYVEFGKRRLGGWYVKYTTDSGDIIRKRYDTYEEETALSKYNEMCKEILGMY